MFLPERLATADLDSSRAALVPLQSLCASETQRKSTTVNWAIRDAVAPLRKVVSRAAVWRTKSEIETAGLRMAFVRRTIFTPFALNALITPKVSSVVPEWEIAIRTSPFFNIDIAVRAAWYSVHAMAFFDKRFSFV